MLLLAATLVSLFLGTSSIKVESTSSLHVTLQVFSGRRDPLWHIQPTNRHFMDIVNAENGLHSTEMGSQLGYGGFSVNVFTDGVYSRTLNIGKCTNKEFEILLLDTVKDMIPEGSDQRLSATVIQYVRDQIDACGSSS